MLAVLFSGYAQHVLELIDIAHYQGEVNFDAIARAGISGVIVKATEGRAPTVDRRFARNWAELAQRRDELVRGAYAFARADTDGGGPEDGRAEAEHFCRTLLDAGAQPDEDFIAALDFEFGSTNPDHSAQHNLDFIAAWVETCEALLGRSPWIYTGVNVWRNRCAWSSRFTYLPLWQASYTRTLPEMPWPSATLWQYTGSGYVDGVQGRVDRNRFDGTLEQLRDLERPRIISPATSPPSRGIFIPFDLNDRPSSTAAPDVALVQGMLLGQGFGPAGLVGSDGLPDGKAGPKTRDALAAFKSLAGLSGSTSVDHATWAALACVRKE